MYFVVLSSYLYYITSVTHWGNRMTISLRHLIESFIREDEEAEKLGWKHLGFGTYEDQSGNRYRKDDAGNWQPVGQEQPATTAQQPAQQPEQPKPADSWQEREKVRKASEREETKQTIAQQVTPLIDRDAIAAIDDEEEREHYSAMADLAELHDDDALEKALRDEKMGDFVNDTLRDAISSSQPPKHLQPIAAAINDIVDEMNNNEQEEAYYARQAGERYSPREFTESDVIDGIQSGEQGFGSNLMSGMRTAMAHSATAAARFYAQQSAKKQQSSGAHDDYEKRVGELEGKGITRSDAQGIADMEFDQKHGKGWEEVHARRWRLAPGGWERNELSESSLREMIRRMSR